MIILIILNVTNKFFISYDEIVTFIQISYEKMAITTLDNGACLLWYFLLAFNYKFDQLEDTIFFGA